MFRTVIRGTVNPIIYFYLFTKEGTITMKKAIKKAMSIMFLLAITVTLNTGVVGTLPQVDNSGIAPMSDMPSPTDIQY